MRTTTLGLFAAVALATLTSAGSAQQKDKDGDKKKDKTASFMERVAKAMPDAAPAKPKQKRLLLVFSRTKGFRHSSIAVGAKTVALLGDKTGAFEAYHTEDESIFEPAKLAKFDAVFMLNTTGDCLRPNGEKKAADEREEVLKKSLADFVGGGKGLLGVHSATDTYHRWTEYNKMMGGTFDGHPWTMKVPVKNLEPKHPLNAAFDGKDFVIDDEIYQFKLTTALPTERKFLLALDVEKMPEAKRGNRKEAGPYPVSWLATHGKGRTFYCSLGHKEEVYTNPAILRHYLAGIQYALGDLEADATPTKKEK